jgi:ketosteroid isomerase-like protein
MPEPATARAVVEALNAAWVADDLDGVIALIAEGCVFEVHVAEALVEHAGRSVGREAVRAALAAARSNFDYILYRPVILSADDATVRQRVEFIGTHKSSGSRMAMSFRQVYDVRGGLVVRCDEYHDAPKVEAFIRMVDPPDGKAD